MKCTYTYPDYDACEKKADKAYVSISGKIVFRCGYHAWARERALSPEEFEIAKLMES